MMNQQRHIGFERREPRRLWTRQADRLGRQKVAQTFLSAHHFAYDGLDLVSETIVDPQTGASNTITRATDVLGRPAGIALSASPYTLTYGYDAYGRFIAVTAQVHVLTHTYTYGYLAGSDLVESMANSHGHTMTRSYDPVMPYITRVHNGFTGDRTMSQYDYTYDALGRRTAIASSGEAFTFTNANDLAAFNLYGYNTRSEVTSATRYWGTDTGTTSEPVAGQEYAYAYDPIGNRITSAEGDTDRTASYTANALNQYTQRTVPGVKELAGTALTNATVTVNSLPTDRYGPWWRHALEVDNASAPAYTQAVVTAVHNPPGTNDPDVVTSQTGRVFVAETPEAFTYNDDGNLLSDGRFTYTWDGENRLIGVTTRDDLPANVARVRVAYTYDHQSRRIASAISTWTNDAWQAIKSRAFLYDGWNVIQEILSPASGVLSTNAYVWGLDLSGTLQGAGGIGGLLSASLDGTPALYCYDANGNVGQLIATSGKLLMHYEYSPFGETVVSTGPLAKANPFRFSTKYHEAESGGVYYGKRYYQPDSGRWINRDPAGEWGGANVYAFAVNEPTSRYDSLGLVSESCKNAWDTYLKNNPKHKKMIDYLKDPNNKYGCCRVTFQPDDCCPDGLAGQFLPGEFQVGEKKCGFHTIRLCCKNSTDYQATIAHELVHFFDKCTCPSKCDIHKMELDEWKTCICAEDICGEMRAYKFAGVCNDFESCWNEVIKRSGNGQYWDAWPCKGQDKGPIKEKLKKECQWATYPPPNPN